MSDAVIKTARRVFEVLEYFREVRRPLAVREISNHCRYPLSSTAVLLKSMATLGYLAYDGELKAYYPTVQIAVLGDWVLESMFADGELLALAESMQRKSGESVVIGVQSDVFVHYAYIIPSHHSLSFFTPVGTRRTLCLSGLGWAILSAQSDSAIRQIVVRTIERLGRTAKPINEDYVFEQVEHVRTRGYAYSRGTITRGVGILAMPLEGGGVDRRLALGIAGPLERMDPELPRLINIMQHHINNFRQRQPG